MITIVGKYGIKATILADSISAAGIRMLSLEIEYPRMILAELNTHRDKSRNSASSRAIPFNKMLTQLTARPVRFGEANPGMQDKGVDFKAKVNYTDADFGYTVMNSLDPENAWDAAKESAVRFSKAFFKAGYHKQVYNRLTEPFQMMKTVISGTEWGNFFWLRDDEFADPTIAELARCMREAKDASTPRLLQAGEWHLPYVSTFVRFDGKLVYGDLVDGEVEEFSLEEAIKVSCARCAAVSYRNEDYGLEKCLELYERLVGSNKKHASALEHCATPMEKSDDSLAVFDKEFVVNVTMWPHTWQEGISHVDRKGQLWSGNLRGFIQYRKTIKGENYE
jgi:thymidylate synthase ThyX